MQQWIVELQIQPGRRGKRSSRTVSWYVRSLRAFYRWCCRRGFVETDITVWLDLPKLSKPLIRILEPEEFSRLLGACGAGQSEHHSTHEMRTEMEIRERTSPTCDLPEENIPLQEVT